MKIFVTGATGFVGREVLPLLREKGHSVIALTRNVERASVSLPVVCEIVEGDPRQSGDWIRKLEGVDAVLHLAGENVARRWTAHRKREIVRSRIESTRNLINIFEKLEQKPSVFVSASAVGYYGDRGNDELNENSVSGAGFLAEVCQNWEKEVFRAIGCGIRTAALRIGVVLGYDGGAMKMMLPPFKLGLGGRLGSGRQWMSWIHLHDLARILVHALESDIVAGPINAVSPNPVTNRDFTQQLADILGRPAIFPVPAIVTRLVFGEMSQILLASQRTSAETIRKIGYKFTYPNLSTALKVICDHIGHELLTEQWVPEPIGSVFAFFTDAKNLETITPPFLHFKILSQSNKRLCEGTIFTYSLQLHGIPFRWKSRITDFQPGVRFSDEQIKGPYSIWHHTHQFIEKAGGTVIRDRIIYKLPGWIPGDVVAHPFIRKDLESIFIYRRKKLEELFGR